MTNYKDIKRIPIVAADVPNLDATKITTGTVNNARITLDAAEIPNLDTAKITTGTMADARIAASNVSQHATSYDDNKLQSNVALLGFKTAVNGSLAKYNLQDQIIDEFTDATGVDASASTNELLASGNYSGFTSVSANYFGASTTDNTTSGTVSVTTPNTNGSYDADMAVVEYDDWTIGHTVTTAQPNRGLLVLCNGNLTINSGGHLNMNARGAFANPSNSGGSDSNAVGSSGLQFGMVTASGSSSFTNDGTGYNGTGTAPRTALANLADLSSNGTIFTIARTGATGGARRTGGGQVSGYAGSNGTTGQSGGGGSGAFYPNCSYSGAGTAGTCFSGGTGGGGGQDGNGTDGAAYGGAGGNSPFGNGSGNPSGGTGGALVIIVKGNVTINSGGTISSNGSNGGAGGSESAGGATGAGNIIICHGGTYTNNGTVTATGGVGGVSSYRGQGGTGGNGSIQVTQVSTTSSAVTDLTLQSTDTTASTANPDYADMVVLMEDAAGTATLNTDIKGYVSEDSGVTFTQGTLVDEGTWGTNKKIIAFHDLNISAQTGSAMCYKITTHNQSASKNTKVHATSMGWR